MYAFPIASLPDDIQPYPLSLSPAGLISEKSNTSLSAGYFPASNFPILLAHASAESPTRRVHTLVYSSQISTFSSNPPLPDLCVWITSIFSIGL